MEAKELRIGNIVNFGIVLEPIIIKGVTEQSSTIEMAEPIPLTEGWLLKFGFEKGHNPYKWKINLYNEENEKTYVIWEKRDFFSNNLTGYYMEECIIMIDYVHQLQNLYFALTGEELTLK